MGLSYRNLDDKTRSFMSAEIERDATENTLWFSDNLSPQGRADFPDLIRIAARSGTDDSLAAAIRGRLNSHEKPRMLKSGGYSKPPVMRSNAHEMLGEGEFNRLYMRALCLRAIQEGIPNLIVYRAKAVQSPRPESEAIVGKQVSPEDLLRDLRTHKGVDTALGLPAGPNSGLSVRLP